MNFDAKLDLVEKEIRRHAELAGVGVKRWGYWPGQQYIVVAVLVAPRDAWEMWGELEGAKVLEGSASFHSKEIAEADTRRLVQLAQVRFTDAVREMWEEATRANGRHNLRLLEAPTKANARRYKQLLRAKG